MLLAAAMLWLASPAPADAGTVTSSVRRGFGEDGPWQTQRIVFRADRGSRDRVALALRPDGAVVRNVRPVRLGAGCQRIGPGAGRCALLARGQGVAVTETTIELHAVTGDRHDLVRVSAPTGTFDAAYVSVSVRGGRGDDLLSVHGSGGASGVSLAGGGGDDLLRGGPGNDGLDGGAGDDVVRGAQGEDVLTLSRGRDTLDGGPNRDWLVARDLRTPVHVDLSHRAASGLNLVRSRLRAIENVEGGAGTDVLKGDAGPNLLAGGQGDRLEGRGGDDVLSGPASLAVGGAGDDVLPWPVDGRLDCGAGQDAIRSPDNPFVLRDVPNSCEWYEGESTELWIARRLRLGSDVLIVPVWNRGAVAVGMRRFVLTRASTPAHAVVDEGYDLVPAQVRRDLRMALTEAGRAYVAHGGSSVFMIAEAEGQGLLWESAFEVLR